MQSKGSGMAVLFGVAIVLFLMEYTNFAQQLSSALSGFSSASLGGAPATPTSTEAPGTVGPSAATEMVTLPLATLLNATGKIATSAEASSTSSNPVTVK